LLIASTETVCASTADLIEEANLPETFDVQGDDNDVQYYGEEYGTTEPYRRVRGGPESGPPSAIAIACPTRAI
jgi:hypothetical protein